MQHPQIPLERASAVTAPIVSVIIVNYNAGQLLATTVQAVLASSIALEVLVSDNGSTDDSLDCLRQTIDSPRLRIIEQQANLGFARANNQVLPLATGKYLLFLNPDCEVMPNTLADMVAVLEQHPEAGMAGPLIKNTDGSEQRGCRREIPTPWSAFVYAFGLTKLSYFFPKLFKNYTCLHQSLPEQPVAVPAISGAFMLVKRTALDEIGAWDPGYFLHCEDLDWCQRFKLAGQKILFIPHVIVTHVKGGCSQARPLLVQWHMHKGMLRFYHKFFRNDYPLPLWWLVVAGVWLRYSLIVLRVLATKLSLKIKNLGNRSIVS